MIEKTLKNGRSVENTLQCCENPLKRLIDAFGQREEKGEEKEECELLQRLTFYVGVRPVSGINMVPV